MNRTLMGSDNSKSKDLYQMLMEAYIGAEKCPHGYEIGELCGVCDLDCEVE